MKLHTDFSTLQKQSNEYCQTKTFSCFEHIKIKMQKKEKRKKNNLDWTPSMKLAPNWAENLT